MTIFKNTFAVILVMLQVMVSCAQNDKMTNEKLGDIINKLSGQVEGQNGNWQFVIDSTPFICLTDVTHNRMRIISPIEELTKLTEDQLLKCMEANFHTVLDSKYAVSEGTLWSVFIHPLKELSEKQVISAISQVYSGAKTFGSLYSSGQLSFPKATDKNDRKKKKKFKRG